MPRFAVYEKPGRRDDGSPFVVQVQSSRLDRSLVRVVIPLMRVGRRAPQDAPLTPHLWIGRQAVYANPLSIATVAAKTLGAAVGTLPENDQDRIIRAIDEMILRA